MHFVRIRTSFTAEVGSEAGEFLHSRIKEITERVFQYKDHSDRLIKTTMISLLPTLAKIGGKEFLSESLSATMSYLLSVDYSKEEVRDAAFRALGDIVVVRILPFFRALLLLGSR